MAFAARFIEVMSGYRTIFGLLTDGLYQRFRQAAEEKRASRAQSVFPLRSFWKTRCGKTTCGRG